MDINIILSGDVCMIPSIYFVSENPDQDLHCYDYMTNTMIDLYPLPHQFSQLTLSHKYNIGLHQWEVRLRIMSMKVQIKFAIFMIERTKYLVKINSVTKIDLNRKRIRYGACPKFIANPQPWEAKKYDSIVLSGGAVLSISILGAITQIWPILDSIDTWFTTSGGAIIAFLYIIGCEKDKIYEFLNNFDFAKCVPNQSYTKSVYNFMKTLAICDGQLCIEDFLKTILKERTGLDDITFRELFIQFGKNLIITTTNISVSDVWYLGIHNYPDMSVIDAVLMSSCLPFLWPPREFNNHLFIDGGVVDNFPTSQARMYRKYSATADYLTNNPLATPTMLRSVFNSTFVTETAPNTLGVTIELTSTKVQPSSDLKASLSQYVAAIAHCIKQKYNELPFHQILRIPIYSVTSNDNFYLSKKEIRVLYMEGILAGRNHIISMN